MHRQHDGRQAENNRQQGEACDGNVDRGDVDHHLAQVVENAPSQSDACDDQAEVLLQEHEIGGLSRDIVPRGPIAMPIWAALSAGASLTPSPVMATISPLAANAATIRSFWLGWIRAKMRDRRTASRKAASSMREISGPVTTRCLRRSPPPGRWRLRWPIVTGDHGDSHAGCARLPHRRGNALPQRVLEGDQAVVTEGEATRALGQAGASMLGGSHRKDAPPLRGELADLSVNGCAGSVLHGA